MAQIRLHLREADGELPMICMCCGEPASVIVRKRLAWFPQWILLLVLVHCLICLLVALIMTKRTLLLAPLCEEHKRHWSNRLLVLCGTFFLLLLYGLGLIPALARVPQEWRDPYGPIIFVVCLVPVFAWMVLVYYVQRSAIHATEITNTEILLDCVCEPFVDAIRKRHDRERHWRSRWVDEEDYQFDKPFPAGAFEEETRQRKKPQSDAIEE